MTAADKIAEARALIEPLTGHTPGPWAAEPGAKRGAWISGTTGEWSALACGDSDESAARNARLIAASPALRETVAALADLADALAQENAELRRMLKSTVCYGCNRRIGDKQWLGFICVSCKSKREFLSRAALGDAP